MSETWLNETNALTDIVNYSFTWLSRIIGRCGGVGVYISSSLRYHVMVKSSLDSVPIKINIDFLLLELTSVNIAPCCVYCPPKIKSNEITAITKYLKSLTKFPLVFGGDFQGIQR